MVVAAIVVPASALVGTLVAGFGLIFASGFAVGQILRRKQERIKIPRPLANRPGVVIATPQQAPPADHQTLEDVSAQPAGQRARPGHLPRSVWAIFGLVIIAPVVVATVLASTSPPPSPPPPTMTQLTEDQLDPGDCLTGSTLGLGTGSPWPYLVTAVPCTRRHLAEVFFAGNLWPVSVAYPGDNTIADQGYARCASAFRAYDGTWDFESKFTIDYIAPDNAIWPSGDRLLVCMAYKPPQPGVPMNYSIKGSHR
jgi:hypothetical protein